MNTELELKRSLYNCWKAQYNTKYAAAYPYSRNIPRIERDERRSNETAKLTGTGNQANS